ncbi:Uncharacterized protein APZ42_026536 [Daphnia magna]|uniref:Uncharacterized protein n=1 Tax=Daphnia magna TaxID=35525 RepID=A0A164S5Q7_9CRUS|nr:Uncharacterized protein APZ42_026536 [Daphnia magna]
MLGRFKSVAHPVLKLGYWVVFPFQGPIWLVVGNCL